MDSFSDRPLPKLDPDPKPDPQSPVPGVDGSVDLVYNHMPWCVDSPAVDTLIWNPYVHTGNRAVRGKHRIHTVRGDDVYLQVP